jgi:hypothetical protein
MIITDYLHMYLPVMVKWSFTGVAKMDIYEYAIAVDRGHLYKPFLRPLSHMTSEENREMMQIELDMEHRHSLEIYAALTKYLLSKKFDVFGLIDAGLAIDASKI